MAGEWIKMRTNLWDDPRISKLCDKTGTSEAAVIGGLYWLWAAADEHTENGVMPGLSIGAIDRKTGIRGLGDALVSIGWIDDRADGITINHFDEHNGASAKSRAQTAKRVANHKANALVTHHALPDQNDSVSDALPREEKRREEESNTSNPDGLDVAGDAGDLLGDTQDPGKPLCPHQKIIDLYHEVLPMCPRIRDWTPARAVQLRARWNEDEKRQNLDWWRKYFEYVKTCDFLVGKTQNPFLAGLDWLTKSSNFTKTREGRYENKGA